MSFLAPVLVNLHITQLQGIGVWSSSRETIAFSSATVYSTQHSTNAMHTQLTALKLPATRDHGEATLNLTHVLLCVEHLAPGCSVVGNQPLWLSKPIIKPSLSSNSAGNSYTYTQQQLVIFNDASLYSFQRDFFCVCQCRFSCSWKMDAGLGCLIAKAFTSLIQGLDREETKSYSWSWGGPGSNCFMSISCVFLVIKNSKISFC